MLRCLRRNPLLFHWATRVQSTPTHLHFLHSRISKTPEPSQSAFTLSYLINSCGLSPESALSAAKRIRLKTTKKPDSLLDLLKTHGFTKTQIADLITKCPLLLSANPQKNIRPKLEFFMGVGYSDTDLGRLISSDPELLQRSLEMRLRPNFDLLKSILGTNNDVAAALRNSSRLLRYNLESMFLPNIETLRDHGVPRPNIAKLAAGYPRVMMQRTERFSKTVESIKKMGFNPSLTLFIIAIQAMSGQTPSTWERKLAVYRSLGWSQGEIISAFMKHPYCMLASDVKIRRAMDFFVKKLHWEPSFISARPKLLCLSFEKRVVPRCSVMSVLVSKGLVRKNSSVKSFLMISEKEFLNKYVIKYGDQCPEVLEAYKGKLEVLGLEAGS